MPDITFLPYNRTITVEPGTNLLDAARSADVLIEAPCGGKGTCGKCIVRITSGEVDSDSLGVLSGTMVADNFVLACRTKITDSDVTVQIPEQLGYTSGRFGDSHEDLLLVRHELLPKKWDFDPLTVKWVVNVSEPGDEDVRTDVERLTDQIQRDWGRDEIFYPLAVIQAIPETIRMQNGMVTVTIIREKNRLHVVKIEYGDLTTRNFGISIDIGTTTVAVQLVNLSNARIIGTVSGYNNQLDCGLDVISRINYAKRPDRLAELRTRVLNTINSLVKKLSEAHSILPDEICNAVIAGNTTMIHLLLGITPEYIRLKPYTPALMNFPYLNANEVGININPHSWVYISPCVGSYVGGDITAGILCTDLATDSEEISLFIDIGTNGELVVGNCDFLLTCACSAGPAFEGGGIGDGMRAAHGAVENVEIDPDTGAASYSVIGNVPPKGICGSGMISLIANLLMTGWIDAAGRLDRTRKSPAIDITGRHASYLLVPAEKSGTGKPIVITELDIDNIIRAKAAIYSACAVMLEEIGIGFGDLSNIYIAGGFGRFLDIEKARCIGLIPDLPKEKFKYIGNSSLMGAYMVLVSQDFQQRQAALARKMTYIDLSSRPGYMDQYTKALFLPHTDRQSFPSVVFQGHN